MFDWHVGGWRLGQRRVDFRASSSKVNVLVRVTGIQIATLYDEELVTQRCAARDLAARRLSALDQAVTGPRVEVAYQGNARHMHPDCDSCTFFIEPWKGHGLYAIEHYSRYKYTYRGEGIIRD